MDETTIEAEGIRLPRKLIGDLAVDLWRIRRRAEKAASETVTLACDRAVERLEEMGLRCDEMVGEEYSQHMRANVVRHEGGKTNPRIVECFAPAVYYTNPDGGKTELIRRAEIAVQGDE